MGYQKYKLVPPEGKDNFIKHPKLPWSFFADIEIIDSHGKGMVFIQPLTLLLKYYFSRI